MTEIEKLKKLMEDAISNPSQEIPLEEIQELARRAKDLGDRLIHCINDDDPPAVLLSAVGTLAGCIIFTLGPDSIKALFGVISMTTQTLAEADDDAQR